MLVDTVDPLAARRFVKKIKEQGLYPIHKILLTHSHFDHVQGAGKLKKMMGDTEIEVLASEKAVEKLQDPEEMNEYFSVNVDPIEDITPLKEGDIIDLNGLKLKIFNFFGHTQDSIAIFDERNKNIFVGDSILDKYDQGTMIPEFVPPEFDESEYLKTLSKLRNLKGDLTSIALGHFGVWKDDDFYKIIDEMEDFYHNTKESIIKWYNENPSLEYITLKYHEKFTPNSKIHTKNNILGLQLLIEWLIDGLKTIGFIK